jgi:superfamily II DNA or RNA helicase
LLLPSLKLHKTPLLTDSMSLFAWDEALAKKYMLMTRFGDPYAMYSRRDKFIELPRNVCPLASIDHRERGEKVPFKLIVGPKDEQQARIQLEQRALLAKDESFIVCAPVGAGKTWMATSAMEDVGRKTLIIVPKEDLMVQWSKRLQQFLGLKPHEIGIIQASKVSVIGKKVVLGMIHSVSMSDRYDPSVFAGFGHVIVDETHRASADSLSQCFRNLKALIRNGYSATPKRKDGKEQLLYAHIGPIMVEGEVLPMVPKVMIFESSWKVPRVVRRDPQSHETKVIQLPHSPGKVGHIISRMVNDTDRNDLLGKLIGMAYAKGRKLIVFTDSLDHVETLMLLAHKNGVPKDRSARYIGGLTEAAREAAVVRDVMVCTWGMMKEGTDVPWFDCALFATPRSDVEQGAGRVLREFPDKKTPILMDVHDPDSTVFRAYANARMRWYTKIGAEVARY